MTTTSDQTERKNCSYSDSDYCGHYIRRCKFVSPCCQKIYTCRFCHNDNESHEICRFEVKEVICSMCNFRQCVGNECAGCGIQFAKYFCATCNLFDDRTERNYFHCNKCGICRVANNEKYIHCDVCNTCIVDGDMSHVCRENVFHNDCPVCLENLFHSVKPSCILHCGHPIHVDCLAASVKNNKNTCSLCRKIIYSDDQLKTYIGFIDAQIELHPFQEELHYDVMCNDCSYQGESKFHPFGMKCGGCGGYNTVKK
jgi:RING finger/CHY zinc finger protein 1